MIAVLIDNQIALRIKRQAVRARLAVLRDVRTAVTTRRSKDAKFAVI